MHRCWETDAAKNSLNRIIWNSSATIDGNGLEPLLAFSAITGNHVPNNEDKGHKTLWLANEAGEIIVDLAIIRYLVKRGHKIIIAFKEGSLDQGRLCRLERRSGSAP